MAVDIAFKADVDLGEGAKSLKSLKQEFKDTQKELDGLTVGSQKYIDTLKKLGAVKDDIGDLNAEINAFNPEGKVQAFGNVISGVASGFQAATGAVALFGGENKELEKQLVKLQAVMAFTEGIKGVVAMGDSFKALSNTMKLTAVGQKIVTAAQWLWNAALNANPIGLLVIGLTALIAGIKLFAGATDSAAEKQERLNKLQEEHIRIIERDIEAIKKLKQINDSSLKSEIDLAKARGASITEIRDLERKALEDKLSDLNYIEGYRGKLTASELKERTDLLFQLTLIDTTYTKTVTDNLQKVADEKIKSNADANKKAIQESGKAWMEEIALKEKNEEARLEREAEISALELEAEKESIRLSGEAWMAGEKLKEDAEEIRVAKEEANSIADFQRQQQQIQTNFAAAKASNDSLQGLSDLFFAVKGRNLKKGSAEELAMAKKQFQINKGLSISSAIISGLQGVINATNAPFPLNIAMPIAVGLTSAAGIAKIASTKFNDGGAGGSMPTISAPSVGNTPTINAPSTSTTSLNPDGTIRSTQPQSQPVIKAVVVETDITQSQNRVSTIENSSLHG